MVLKALPNMNLSLDQAQLNFVSRAYNSYSIWAQREDCFKCGLEWIGKLTAFENAAVVVDTAHDIILELRNYENETVSCTKLLSLKEHGVYQMNISNTVLCPPIVITHEPDHIYNPLYFVIGLYIFLLTAWYFGKYAYRAQWYNKIFGNNPIIAEIENDLGSPNSSSDNVTLLRSSVPQSPVNTPVPPQMSRSRARSLDVLRGIAIFLMIFVNYGGGKYSMFEHSAWNGLTAADFIFPWFVWIMGVSLTFSLCSKLRSGTPRIQLFIRVLKRSCYLIIIGLVLSNVNNPDLSKLRFAGVLQRLGVSYFFVASVETFLMRPQPIFTYDSHGYLYHIRDFIESWPQWIFMISVALLHTIITFFLPVPNCPTGYLGPGGLSDFSSHYNCTGGAAGYIDRTIFGLNHIHNNPTCKKLYKTEIPFDPEGLLGTLTTIVLMYLGVYAGRVMLCFQKTRDRVIRWIIAAVVLGLLGLLLCGFTQDQGLIPLNKNLWSLSMVCVTASTSFILMSIFLFIVDHLDIWSGTPFHQAGKNAIFLYIGHVCTRNQFPWAWALHNTANHMEYTIMHVWGALLWLLISVFMYEKEMFFTI